VLLASVLLSFTDAYKKALADISSGTYGTHGYNLTLANGGISLLKTRYISAKVWTEIQAAQTRIQQGKLKVPLTTKASQVKALINQK
jgi:simple sugar transport system substrate-binding protein